MITQTHQLVAVIAHPLAGALPELTGFTGEAHSGIGGRGQRPGGACKERYASVHIRAAPPINLDWIFDGGVATEEIGPGGGDFGIVVGDVKERQIGVHRVERGEIRQLVVVTVTDEGVHRIAGQA